jgi:hypothetical protein
MRLFYRSMTRPKNVAQRLHTVFPALSLSTSQKWAARLVGYRDWHELHQFTSNHTGDETADIRFPVTGEAMPDEEQVRLLAARSTYQKKVLAELAGDFLVEINALHAMVDPNQGGFAFKKLTKQLGVDCTEKGMPDKGSPFYRGLQYDLYSQSLEGAGARVCGIVEKGRGTGQIHLGLPQGESEDDFFKKVLRKIQSATRLPEPGYILQASAALRSSFGESVLHLNNSGFTRETDGATIVSAAQYRVMRFFALDDGEPQGFAVVSTTADAWSDKGSITLFVEIQEAWALDETLPMADAFARSITAQVKEALCRILWMRVDNPDYIVHVQVLTNSKSIMAWRITDRVHSLLSHAIDGPGMADRRAVTFTFDITQWGKVNHQPEPRQNLAAEVLNRTLQWRQQTARRR